MSKRSILSHSLFNRVTTILFPAWYYRLYYWISDKILQTKSEVALGVHNIIKEAGIDTPRPKGDFNLKIIDAPDKQQIMDKGDKDKNK